MYCADLAAAHAMALRELLRPGMRGDDTARTVTMSSHAAMPASTCWRWPTQIVDLSGPATPSALFTTLSQADRETRQREQHARALADDHLESGGPFVEGPYNGVNDDGRIVCSRLFEDAIHPIQSAR